MSGTIMLSAVIHLSEALALSTPMTVRFRTRVRRGLQMAAGAVLGLASLRMLTARG